MPSWYKLGMRLILWCLAIFQATADAFSPQPGFDLVRAVGMAELIARGKLAHDGTFTISEVLAGKAPESKTISFENVSGIVDGLVKPLKLTSDPDIIVFLEKPKFERHHLFSTRLIAADENHGLWGWFDDFGMSGNRLQPMTSVTEASFKEFILQKMKETKEFKDICRQPRSVQRVERIIRFLRDHREDVVRRRMSEDQWLFGFMGWQNFYVERAAAELAGMSEEESESLLRILAPMSDDQGTAMGLYILAHSPCPPKLFSRLKAYVDPSCGILTRRIAFEALVRCDYDLGAAFLIPFLRSDEPQIRDLLQALSSLGADQNRWPDEIVAPLKHLGEQLLISCQQSRTDEDVNQGYAVIHAMSFFSHPSFIPLMLKWAKPMSSHHGQASSNLVNALGFGYGAENMQRATDWVEANETALTASYDLKERPEVWMKAYKSADIPLRKLLLRLWQFENGVDAAKLSKQFGDGEYASECHAIMRHLWETKLLTRDFQRELVKRYISFSLEMRQGKEPIGPERLYLVRTVSFPFPKDTWVYWNMDCAVDRPPLVSFPDDFKNSSNLDRPTTSVTLIENVKDIEKQKIVVTIEYLEGNIQIPQGERWRYRWEVKWPKDR